jgi:predicted N-acetyltransferase YhbS
MSLLVQTLPPSREPKPETRIAIRRERRADIAAREVLLDTAFGAGRFAKTSERLRAGRVPARGLAFVAFEGRRLVGTVRLWSVVAGTAPRCLLLGPLAVAADARDRGIGAALTWHALHKARRLGHRAVLLVGDAAYYDRFGFSAEKTGALRMLGPYERDRLLACELVPGALEGARGTIAVIRPPPSRLSIIIDSVACSGPALPKPA